MANEIDFSENDGLNEEGGTLYEPELDGEGNLEDLFEDYQSTAFNKEVPSIENVKPKTLSLSRQPRKKLKLKPRKVGWEGRKNVIESTSEVPKIEGLLGTPVDLLSKEARLTQLNEARTSNDLTEAQAREISSGFAGKVQDNPTIQYPINSAELAMGGVKSVLDEGQRLDLQQELLQVGNIKSHITQYNNFDEEIIDTSVVIDNGIDQYSYQLTRFLAMPESNKAFVRDLVNDPNLVATQSNSKEVTPAIVKESLRNFEALIGTGRAEQFVKDLNIDEVSNATSVPHEQNMMVSMLGISSETKNIAGAGDRLPYTHLTQKSQDKADTDLGWLIEQVETYSHSLLDQRTRTASPKLYDKRHDQMKDWLYSHLKEGQGEGAIIRDYKTGLPKEFLDKSGNKEFKHRSLSLPEAINSGILGAKKLPSWSGFGLQKDTGLNSKEFEAMFPTKSQLFGKDGKYDLDAWKASEAGQYTEKELSILQGNPMAQFIDSKEDKYQGVEGKTLLYTEQQQVKDNFKRMRKILRKNTLSLYDEDMGNEKGAKTFKPSADALDYTQASDEAALLDLGYTDGHTNVTPSSIKQGKGSDQTTRGSEVSHSASSMYKEAIAEGIDKDLAIDISNNLIDYDTARRIMGEKEETQLAIDRTADTSVGVLTTTGMTDKEEYLDRTQRNLRLGKIHHQGTDDWLKQREGNVTATMTSGLLGNNKKTNVEAMASHIHDPEKFVVNGYTRQGSDFEDRVRREYSKEMGYEVEEAFYETSEGNERFGASPDGFAFDSEGKFKNLTEFKVHDSIKAQEQSLKKYTHQAQWQMYITGADEVHLATINTVDERFQVQSIKRDDKLIKQLVGKSEEVLRLADKKGEEEVIINKLPYESRNNGDDPHESFEGPMPEKVEVQQSYSADKSADKPTKVTKNKAKKGSKYNEQDVSYTSSTGASTAIDRILESVGTGRGIDFGGKHSAGDKIAQAVSVSSSTATTGSTKTSAQTEADIAEATKARDHREKERQRDEKYLKGMRDRHEKQQKAEFKSKKEHTASMNKLDKERAGATFKSVGQRMAKQGRIGKAMKATSSARGGVALGMQALGMAADQVLTGATKEIQMHQLGANLGISGSDAADMQAGFMKLTGGSEKDAVMMMQQRASVDQAYFNSIDGVEQYRESATRYSEITGGDAAPEFQDWKSMGAMGRSEWILKAGRGRSLEEQAGIAQAFNGQSNVKSLALAMRSEHNKGDEDLLVGGRDTSQANLDKAITLRNVDGKIEKAYSAEEMDIAKGAHLGTYQVTQAGRRLLTGDTGAKVVANIVNGIGSTVSEAEYRVPKTKEQVLAEEVEHEDVMSKIHRDPDIEEVNEPITKVAISQVKESVKSTISTKKSEAMAKYVVDNPEYKGMPSEEVAKIESKKYEDKHGHKPNLNRTHVNPELQIGAVHKNQQEESKEDNKIDIKVTISEEDTSVETTSNLFGQETNESEVSSKQ